MQRWEQVVKIDLRQWRPLVMAKKRMAEKNEANRVLRTSAEGRRQKSLLEEITETIDEIL